MGETRNPFLPPSDDEEASSSEAVEKVEAKGAKYDPEPVYIDDEFDDDFNIVLDDGMGDSADADVEKHWFVVHCYSGYENKVKHAVEQRIETMGR